MKFYWPLYHCAKKVLNITNNSFKIIQYFEKFTQYLLKIEYDLRKFYLLCVVFWNTLVHIVSIWLSKEKYKSDLVYDTVLHLIKIITKFLNVIGYYQPNLDTYRIYVHIMLVIGQCQHIMPKYVDSNSHVHMQLYLFYENVYIRCLVSLLNFVILWVNSSQNFVIQFSINILSHD